MLRLLLIGLTIICIALFIRLWIGTGNYGELWRMRAQIEERKEANAQQKDENRKLQAEVAKLKGGDEILEERARSELGFIRQGETFYRIIMQPEPTEDTPEKELENQTADPPPNAEASSVDPNSNLAQ